MAQFKTTPVFFCKRCGKRLRVKQAMSFNDPTGENLNIIAKVLGEMAYCDYHLAQRNYYSQQGRLQDWEDGNL